MSVSIGRDAKAVTLLGGRNLIKGFRTPMLITASLLQPIIWLVMFSQTFKGLGDSAQFRSLGYRSYLDFFVPSMVVLSMLFTALQSGMATITDIDTGMMDKFTISPIHRFSILLGRVIADAVTMVMQGGLILIVATFMSARVITGWRGVVGILAFAVVFGVVWASLSNFIALRTRNSELTMVMGLFLTLPALFLSSAFFPQPLLPGWLRVISKVNPTSYVIDTAQHLMNLNNSWSQDGKTLLVLAISGAILIPAAVMAFRSATR